MFYPPIILLPDFLAFLYFFNVSLLSFLLSEDILVLISPLTFLVSFESNIVLLSFLAGFDAFSALLAAFFVFLAICFSALLAEMVFSFLEFLIHQYTLIK